MSSSRGVRGLIRRAVSIPAAVLALGVVGALLAPPAQALDFAQFTVPGSYTWTVPPGVFSAQFALAGAAGGWSGGGDAAFGGGTGGQLTATLYVTPGETYTIVVGGRGGAPGGLGTAGGVGGSNGGANGGSAQHPAGGGGGATDVRRGGSDLSDRVLVAGGGGGDSGPGGTGIGAAHGGQGSGGAPGSDGTPGSVPGGRGGAATAGGAGGLSSPPDASSLDGQAGTAGAGGSGGGGSGTAGGGGGGGWFGGGGGADTADLDRAGGGGGGGSGYADPTAVSVSTGLASRNGDGAVNITWTAVDPSLVVPTLPGVPPRGLLGTYYDFDFQPTGFPLPVCSVTAGTPPPGIQLTSDCLLQGTPTATGSYPFTVAAVNGTHPVSDAVTVEIGQEPTIEGLPWSGWAGNIYASDYVLTGVPTPTTSVTDGALPPGVELSSNGHLSGVPTVPGSYTFTVTATNGFGRDASLVSTIVVMPNPLLPTISGTPPAGGVGEPYSFTFSTTATAESTVSVQSGTLPQGLTLSSLGVLSGTPTVAGTYPFTVSAANGNATATEDVVLVIRPRPSLAIGDRSVLEGNSGTRALVFTVRLSRASTIPVTVHWHTANGTALAGSDYTAASGMLTFRPGQTTVTVTVLVHGDRIKEPTETFHVRLTNPGGASIADGDALGHIVNDD